MIFEELAITNFGAYAGRQTINLAPSQKEKPIILIGGLNGAGKTSILKAVRIVLYGKRVVTLEEKTNGYLNLLKDLSNDSSGGLASIELSFRTFSLGNENLFRIRRSWEIVNNKAKEMFEAWKNDEPDQVLSDTWDDFIDSLIPVSISPLFFFDGEKAAEYASQSGAAELLRIGVQSLLGIDLLAKLKTDLADLIFRKAKTKQNTKLAIELDSINKELDELGHEQLSIRMERGKLVNHRERLQNSLRRCEEKLKEIGADLFFQQDRIDEEYQSSTAELELIKAELINLAAGPLPLSMLSHIIQNVIEQDFKEQKSLEAAIIIDVLKERDREVVKRLKGISVEHKEIIQEYLNCDRRKRLQEARTERLLNLSMECRTQLSGLAAVLYNEQNKVDHLLEHSCSLGEKVRELEQKLRMIPPEESLAMFVSERDEIKRQVQDLDLEIGYRDRQLDNLRSTINYKEDKKDRVLRKDVAMHLQNDQDDRIMFYAEKSRELAADFEGLLLNQLLARLQNIILDCISVLFRKVDFIRQVNIDPSSFRLAIFDGNNKELPIERLSSAECQLLIIAILWGLARASGRPLPVIVDTPLGRLDSSHRHNLVARYYAMASHQVILLSTDTEIDQNLLPRLNLICPLPICLSMMKRKCGR